MSDSVHLTISEGKRKPPLKVHFILNGEIFWYSEGNEGVRGMKVMLSAILETVRVLVITVFFFVLASLVVTAFFEDKTNINYQALIENNSYLFFLRCLQALGILGFIYILYRNKYQFSGWYKGKRMQRLSKRTTRVLFSISLVYTLALYLVVWFMVSVNQL